MVNAVHIGRLRGHHFLQILLRSRVILSLQSSVADCTLANHTERFLCRIPLLVGVAIGLGSSLNRLQAAGAKLSGFSFPGDAPYYRVRVRAPGEIRRLWGMTTIYIAADDGRVLGLYDARRLHSAPRMLLDIIYPLHTGQIGGFFGRLIVLMLGLSLIAMIGLGVGLWWVRRPKPRP